MKNKIKKQFVLCFLTETKVITDAELGSSGVRTATEETFTFEAMSRTFDSKFEALLHLQTLDGSGVEFTILEKLQVVKEDK